MPGVSRIVSPYTAVGAQVSKEGSVAFASVTFDRPATDVPTAEARRFVSTATSAGRDGLQVAVAGQVAEEADPGFNSPLQLVTVIRGPARRAALDRAARDVGQQPGVARVAPPCACRESRPWLWPAELLSLPSGRDDHRSCACGSCSS